MTEKKKSSFKRLVSPKGPLQWPHLTKADEYKGVKKFKTNQTLDGSSKQTKAFIADIDEAVEASFQAATEKLEEKVATGKGKDKAKARESLEKLERFTPYEPEYDDEGDETGNFVIKTSIAEDGKNSKTGETWKNKVALVDAKGKALPRKGLKIWGGTVARISVQLVPFFNDATNQAGITLRLVGVQIIELVSGGSGRSAESMGFEEEDGFSADDLDEIIS